MPSSFLHRRSSCHERLPVVSTHDPRLGQSGRALVFMIAALVAVGFIGWSVWRSTTSRSAADTESAAGAAASSAPTVDAHDPDDPSCGCSDPETLGDLEGDATTKERVLRELHERAQTDPSVYLSDHYKLKFGERVERFAGAGNKKAEFPNRLAYGDLLMSVGDIDESITQIERAVELARAGHGYNDQSLPNALFLLGVAHFRLAERRNCIAHHNQESCIYPLEGAAVHVEPAPARGALGKFEEVLAIAPEYTEAEWMLNIAHMALGTWPEGVPEKHRLGHDHFASEVDIGRFVDVGSSLGLNRYTRGGSVVLEDFDNDGRLDVMTSTMDTGMSVRLYRNLGDGDFDDVSESAGLEGQLGGMNLVPGDYDGDGLIDVLVLRGGELVMSGRMPCSLLRQKEPGVFEDVTDAAGLAYEAPTQTAAFADIDNDGDLDLFVGYETQKEPRTRETIFRSRLYRNRGDGTFENVVGAGGIERTDRCGAVCFGDIDGDGFADLYVSNRLVENALYRNRGDGTFEDVTDRAGVAEPIGSRAAFFFDFDNDGDLDLFCSSSSITGIPIRQLADYYRSKSVAAPLGRLYENDGTGTFADVTQTHGLHRTAFCLGATSGDVDNDGFADLYFGTGIADMAALWPNLMLKNDGGRRFQDATRAAGLGHLQKCQSMAFGDLDNDGDQDLFLQVGGWHLDDAFGDVLFRNPGHDRHWLSVELTGTTSNRFGVGARLRATVRDAEGVAPRDVYAWVGIGTSSGHGSLRTHLGLGAATVVEELEVVWPGAGRQVLRGVSADRRIRIRQGSDDVEIVPLETADFGG